MLIVKISAFFLNNRELCTPKCQKRRENVIKKCKFQISNFMTLFCRGIVCVNIRYDV